MFVKISGAALIFGASAMTAKFLIHREKKRLEIIEGFSRLVTFIRDRIDTYSTPVKRILADCDEDTKKKLGVDFIPTDFGQILDCIDSYLDETGRKILKEFSSTLGKSYRDIQIKQCNKTLAELEALEKELQIAYLAKKKTVTALCLGLGGMAVIALI